MSKEEENNDIYQLDLESFEFYKKHKELLI